MTKQFDEQKTLRRKRWRRWSCSTSKFWRLESSLQRLIPRSAIQRSGTRTLNRRSPTSARGSTWLSAKRVQELSQYRSTFFGELKRSLGERDDIQVVGDRFVFQSEIFFESGSADLAPQGFAELEKLATALKDLENRIPKDLAWVLRIDGHTDIRPICDRDLQVELGTVIVARDFRCEISDLERRAAEQAGGGWIWGIPTSGNGGSDADLRRNRRIELKLTEK